MKTASIQGYMTTADAAKATGLSAHQIGCLARSGEIDAFKNGNTILVNAATLQSYAMSNQGRGRPMDAKTAYGALWLLTDLEAAWLNYPQQRRLRLRLQSTSVESLSWQLRKRAETHRYRASESFIERIAGSLLLSGVSSSHLTEFGLLDVKDVTEGYCLNDELHKLTESSFMTEDPQGNVVIHSASWLPSGILNEMPLAVVAADLTQSLNTRERKAGLNILRRLLDEYRQV